jgi:lipid A disaccharide synthetase
MKARLLQLTNNSIGAIATNINMPLGVVTVVYPGCDCQCQTYSITSSTSDTLVINRAGTYQLIYNASLVATAAGNIVLELKLNGVTKYTVTVTATAAGTVNVTIPYELYIPCNCCNNPTNVPAYVQIQSTGVAITSGTSNLIVDKE